MSGSLIALKPTEAAYIATNAYFALEGWELRYNNDDIGNSVVKKGLSSPAVMNKHIVSGAPTALNKVGVTGTIKKPLTGASGSRLASARTGFGYMLTFKRAGKKHLVIATRGTRYEMGYNDLYSDANISPMRAFPGVGPVHAGFFDCFNSLKSQLDAPLITSVDYIHCVGHSLGGAIANLVALHCARITGKRNIGLYTFGAPRVGLEFAMYHKVVCKYLGEDNIYRVSHNRDPVPAMCLPPYQHVHPSITSKRNYFLKSPNGGWSLDNHDTGEYIKSCMKKSWLDLEVDSLTQLEVDKQFFMSWVNDDSWIKSRLGMAGNVAMNLLIKIVTGLVARTAMLAFMGIASPIDLVAIAVEKGTKAFGTVMEFAIKLIKEIAKVFGILVKESEAFLVTLLEKMKAQSQQMVKMAIVKAQKSNKKCTEITSVLEGADSIGFKHM